MAEVRLEGRQPGCRPEHVRSRLAASGRKPRPAWSVRLRGVRPLRLPAASWTRGDHRAADPRRGRCSHPPAILAAAIFTTRWAAPTGIRLSTGAQLHSIGNRPPRLNVATGCMVGFLWPSGPRRRVAARCSGKRDPHARPLYPASPTAGSSGTTWPSSSLSSSRPGPVSAGGPASLTHPSSSGGGSRPHRRRVPVRSHPLLSTTVLTCGDVHPGRPRVAGMRTVPVGRRSHLDQERRLVVGEHPNGELLVPRGGVTGLGQRRRHGRAA